MFSFAFLSIVPPALINLPIDLSFYVLVNLPGDSPIDLPGNLLGDLRSDLRSDLSLNLPVDLLVNSSSSRVPWSQLELENRRENADFQSINFSFN